MSPKKSDSRFVPTANPEMAQAMREKRRSSAASPHVPKTRKGSRNQRRRIAIERDGAGFSIA